MAKRITHYSKLTREKRDYLNSMLDDKELKILDINLKKGVIVNIDQEECFVVLDTWQGFDNKKDEDEDEDEEEVEDDELE